MAEDSSAGSNAALLTRVRPGAVALVAAGILVIAWGLVFASEWFDAFGLRHRHPLWMDLFNNRPVEWSQWFVLAAAIAAAGFLAGRLHAGPRRRAALFFAWLAIGIGLMLIEEAGDIRHDVSGYVARWFGQEIFGLPYRVVSDVPYFALLAVVPLYAILRYGRDVWPSRSMRPYLVGAYGLYALAGVASGLRHYRQLYSRIGARIDALLFDGVLTRPETMDEPRKHFMIVDSMVEETVELFAAAFLLAAVLAFARDHEAGRLPAPAGARDDRAPEDMGASPPA
jgi:hypothetical protein